MVKRDDSKIFNSKERTKFFTDSGLPFWDAFYENQVDKKRIYYPYALYTCQKEPIQKLDEIKNATLMMAAVFEKAIKDIRKWTIKDLEKWSFNPKFAKLLDIRWDDFFCFRAGWGWKDGKPKLLEINSQTPSFWFEPELGNFKMEQEFGLKNPIPDSNKNLKGALNQAIDAGIKKLPGIYGESPKVGFVTCNWYEDLHIMNWLATFCEFDCEVLSIEEFDMTKSNNIPFNRKTGTHFDAIIFWYPIEWLLELKFQNGEPVWDVLVEALNSETFALIHAIPSFFIQSKATLAYITENSEKYFTGELKTAEQYFTKTYLSDEFLSDNYFAKPIWGREGRGAFLIKNGEKRYSRYQEDYYVKQKKVYQELLEMPKVKIGDKDLNVIYESWVYRVGNKFVPGAIGLRGSEHPITDDFSYWIPIGI